MNPNFKQQVEPKIANKIEKPDDEFATKWKCPSCKVTIDLS